MSDPLESEKEVEEKGQPTPGGAPGQAGKNQERKQWPKRGWGASPGSRGWEKKAEAATGEQRRGEVRQQAGLGRAGSRMGRESEKLEQPQW